MFGIVLTLLGLVATLVVLGLSIWQQRSHGGRRRSEPADATTDLFLLNTMDSGPDRYAGSDPVSPAEEGGWDGSSSDAADGGGDGGGGDGGGGD